MYGIGNSKIGIYQGNLYKTGKNDQQNNTSTTKGYYFKNTIRSIVMLEGIKEEESLNINNQAFQNGNNILMNHDNENTSEEIGYAYVQNYSSILQSSSSGLNISEMSSLED